MSINNQIIKSFNNHEVRAIDINNQIWFIANDIAKALSYSNARDAINRHVDKEDVVKYDTPTTSGVQSISYLNESGMYSLVLKSKKPESKSFKRWVTSEVLPSIRKNGSYIEVLTPKQQCKIQQAVNQIAIDTGNTHQSIWRSVKDKFEVGSYKDILSNNFDDVIEFLGYTENVKPVKKKSIFDLYINFNVDEYNKDYLIYNNTNIDRLFNNI